MNPHYSLLKITRLFNVLLEKIMLLCSQIKDLSKLWVASIMEN